MTPQQMCETIVYSGLTNIEDPKIIFKKCEHDMNFMDFLYRMSLKKLKISAYKDINTIDSPYTGQLASEGLNDFVFDGKDWVRSDRFCGKVIFPKGRNKR